MKKIFSVFALTLLAYAVWASQSSRTVDVTVNPGIANNSQTAVTVTTGQGKTLPAVPPGGYLMPWWDQTKYNQSTQDPNYEVVNVTNVTGDVLTIVRAQGGTTAHAHNISGDLYRMFLGTYTIMIADSDVNIVGGSVTVSGISNLGVTFNGAQPVSFSGPQPVSVTNAISVSGTVTANQGGTWTVGVNNFPTSITADQGGIWSVGVNNFPSSFNVGNWPTTFNLGTNNPVSVTNQITSVTANAGTNLNTSLLALETGGHLASLDGKAVTINTGAIAGTVTANQGGTWTVGLGANNPVSVTNSLTVSLGSNNPVSITNPNTNISQETGGNLAGLNAKAVTINTGAVAGTVTANAGTGTFTVSLGTNNPVSLTNPNTNFAQETGGNLAGLNSKAVTINTGAVSGTVTANQGGTWTVGLGTNNPVSITNPNSNISQETGGNLASLNSKTVTINTGAIAGTVTANAGTGTFNVSLGTNNPVSLTNSNTNIAQETGGNLASLNSKAVTINTGAVAGTVTANQGGTWTVGLGTNNPVSVTNSIGVTGSASTFSAAVSLFSWLGSIAPTVGSKTSANSLPVVIASDQAAVSVAVSNWLGSTAPTVGSKTSANSLPVVIASDQAALTIVQATAANLNAQVSGNAASGSAVSGNPIYLGARVSTAPPATVADGQAVGLMATGLGKLVVKDGAPRNEVTTSTTTLNNTNETTILAAGGSGVFLDMKGLTMTNSSAATVRVDIRDSTSGTVRMSFDLASNGGAVVPFVCAWPQNTANNNWTAQLSNASVTVHINAEAIQDK